MADDIWISNHGIGYDLSLLDKNSEYDRKLEVSIRISIAITNIWKGIYKTALTGEQIEIDNKSDNYLDIYPSNATTGLPKELVSEVMANLTLEPANPRTLDILPPNSDFRTVCNHIPLLLSLN